MDDEFKAVLALLRTESSLILLILRSSIVSDNRTTISHSLLTPIVEWLLTLVWIEAERIRLALVEANSA